VYFDLLTPAEFDDRAAMIAADRERARKLEAARVGFVKFQTSGNGRIAPVFGVRTVRTKDL
jgi:hypothetical protein